ncbi:MAG: alpha/beta fold hydrolase [Rhodospirillaceae bacterium]|nr:alpha/beta fold hydrolase [Rhodospirillaceae bacterium]
MTDFSFEKTSRMLSSPAGDLHYHEAGTGPVLLLLHGSGPGVTGWANFEKNLPVFAHHFRTIILDLPGYGKSAPVDGNPMQASVDGVIRFMDGLKLDTAHIVGNSLGGMIGAMLGAQHPKRLSRLVSIGGIGYNVFTAFPGEGINLLTEFVEDPTRARIEQWLRSMVYDQSIVTDELIERRLKQALDPVTMASSKKLYSRASLAGLKAMNEGPNVAMTFSYLAAIQAPTLLTWGRDDRVSPLERAFVAMRMIPNCELHVFPKCGHWAMIEHKTAFERLVIEFLQR